MHCPHCGNKMEIVEHKKEIEEPKDWDNDEEVDAYFDKQNNIDESVWWICPVKHCFGNGFELVMHHAPGFEFDEGKDLMKTKPGDSWSLTWLK